MRQIKFCILFLICILLPSELFSQKWSKDGISYYHIEQNELVKYNVPTGKTQKVISRMQLSPEGYPSSLYISNFIFSDDEQKILIFTNTKRVWRLETKGDYWIFDLKTGALKQIGKSLPSSSLMFAKFSPDGNSVAYVSDNNIYAEDLSTHQIKPLTFDGSVTLINGTFDWVYEEEFYLRDGFRWSPDGKSIAFWQLDASEIKKFYMINNTDSVYSRIIPLEYPKTGEKPSSCRIGIINISDTKTTWINLPGETDQNYIVRTEFIPGTNRLLIQQLNRKQNNTKLFISDIFTGNSEMVYEESDKAWVDIDYYGEDPYAVDFSTNFIWSGDYKSILWISEKDGWRHLYRISLEGKPEKLITAGNYDIIDYEYADQENGLVYFLASPDNATQKYLYSENLDGTGKLKLISPEILKGTHDYEISPGGKYAWHSFSNHHTRGSEEFISLPGHKPLDKNENIIANLDKNSDKTNVEFFKIKIIDNIEMDGWMVKPENFNPDKKYPVVFYVYTEPGSATVVDGYHIGNNRLYIGNMAADGYIYISVDNRGTPVPKGREWRKSIYRQIGTLNIHDQAMAAKEILKWNFIDKERVAVWGWSGGGSATLNLMFQYPDIYKTGIAVAAISNELTYDNIYKERYMGLPQENIDDYTKGSAITHAKNLKGNLLLIHGTGDDNVHYQNAEMLINELVKYNKQFQFMAYPNRTHGLHEGKGTYIHLMTLYTNFLKQYCPPGGK